ncbi:MAG: hypothetical protein J0L77_06190 [Alphaproteobacteria bacterium]|nr:hypothetical protein [Alphaproteobacteria bacterium]
MALAQVIDYRFQNVLRDGDGMDNVPDLIHDDFFRYPDFLCRVLRIAGDQVNIFALFQIAGYPATRQGARNQPVQGKGKVAGGWGRIIGVRLAIDPFAGFIQGFVD